MKTNALLLLAIFACAGCQALKTDAAKAPPPPAVIPEPAPVAGTELDQSYLASYGQ